MGAHRPYFTCVAPAVLVLVWAFMAGQYAAYQAVAAPASLACLAAQHASGAAPAWGPRTLVRWIAPRQGEWCFGVSAGKFNARYMIDWGARWAPDMGSR